MLVAIDKAIDSVKFEEVIDRTDFENYCHSRSLWEDLGKVFRNVWGGIYRFRGINLLGENEELLNKLFEEYLNFYLMLGLGWEEIEIEFKSLNYPKSPGDTLIYILESESRHRWVTRETRSNKRTLYKAYLQYKKCEKLPKLPDSQTEHQKFEQLMSQLYKKKPLSCYPEHALLQDACVDICLRSKKKSIKISATKYLESRQEHADYVSKRLRRSF